jgi:hypothetical protein
MSKGKLEEFLTLVSDLSITDDAWSDVFMSVGHDMMSEVNKNYDTKMIKKAYLNLKDTKSRFKFMQVWSQAEDFSNFEFFLDQISHHDVETSEIIFDNLRNWNLDERRKIELLNSIKKVVQRSTLLDIAIERLIN